MTELDTHTLRRALRAPADLADSVDIATIVRRGRSMRRRRRLVAVAGGACAAAALVGALTAITHLTRPASAPATYPVSGRTTPGPSPRLHRPSMSPPALTTPEPKATPQTTPTAVPAPSLPGRQRVSATDSPGSSRVTSVPSASSGRATPSPTASSPAAAISPIMPSPTASR
jgi:hypothetical protein